MSVPDGEISGLVRANMNSSAVKSRISQRGFVSILYKIRGQKSAIFLDFLH